MNDMMKNFIDIIKPIVAILIALMAFDLLIRFIIAKTKKNKNIKSSTCKDAIINDYPYVKRILLSKAESEFYKILQICIPDNYLLFAKVRLWDFIDTTAKSNRIQYTNKIQSKHVDYLITDTDGNPLVAIELDDASHNYDERKKRDNFVDNTLNAAQISIIRIHTSYSYSKEDIERQIKEAIKK